jgi:hypothetical protein
VLERLPSKHKALSPNPTTAKKKKKVAHAWRAPDTFHTAPPSPHGMLEGTGAQKSSSLTPSLTEKDMVASQTTRGRAKQLSGPASGTSPNTNTNVFTGASS